MKKSTRIILIILCSILIALSVAGVIWSFVNKFTQEAHAEEIENNTTFVNFNQLFNNNNLRQTPYYNIDLSKIDNGTYHIEGTNTNWTAYIAFDSTTANINIISGHKYFIRANCTQDKVNCGLINTTTQDSYVLVQNYNSTIYTASSSFTCSFGFYINVYFHYNFNVQPCLIDLTQMFGAETANTMTIEQCEQLFNADYYPYNTGTTIDLSGFEQYNAGAMSARESMTINTTSANVADNLDNVVINSSYGSNSKALIQGYMVWGSSDYANCTALFNLETNFNEGDYFEFEFYTITGADSAAGLPNISTFYDLQIIAVDNSGNIVPLTNVKAQNNPNATTKATFYLPFATDKLYISTPHKYIIGYNNFKINITTTNLTALSLYSYKDGFREGRSNGYTSGYNAGISQQNATIGTMEYIGAAFNGIGSILQIELLPNVPLSLFILLPLMFGLITFVVKLSKGGS